MRILLDTNIIVAGFLSPRGPPGILLLAWLQGRFELVTSRPQLEELARVLAYDRLRDRIHPVQAREFVENVEVLAVLATELPVLEVSSDPADNVILATAIAGQAELVVSGDKAHVLELREVEGIPIVSAREAVSRLGLSERTP